MNYLSSILHGAARPYRAVTFSGLRLPIVALSVATASLACTVNITDFQESESGSSATTSTGGGGSTGTSESTASSTTTEGTESTTASTTSAETDATTTTTTTTDASTSTSSTSDGTTDPTGGLNCNPKGLPECAIDSCTQRWAYGCDECGIEFDRATCFEIDVQCAYPQLTCGLPKPCERVWAYGQDFGVLDTFESEDAASCILTSLRDGDLAHHEVLWGQMSDVGVTRMDVFADGSGGVTLQWEVACEGCPTSGVFGRSGVLQLQDQAFFDSCLNAPTTATLLDCVFGFTEFDEGSGLATGETPPWTTGECSALEFACPG